ncbi:MAG TPA: metal ABC transporter substrate-binding protein [Acidimicrobiales bacterium]|nr:metal ABC transporter substrate-binding protein [Acidimicrobiales bacterium]
MATGLYPLAQMARLIGGTKVVVVDVVPPGTDPLTFHPDAAQARVLTGSGLVVEIGGGFQPGLESATAGASMVERVGSDVHATDPYVWLDPPTMEKVVTAMAAAMGRADPQAAPLFERNAGGLDDQIQSLGYDYSNTLSSCPGNTMVTADSAFSTMAAGYGLEDHITGPAPDQATVSRIRAALPADSPVAAIGESWVDDAGLNQVAQATGLKVHTVDTLAGTPTNVTGQQATYFSQMEKNLGAISGALGCNANEQ